MWASVGICGMIWAFRSSIPEPLPVSVQDVKYPEYLDIRPYMSQPNGEPIIYVLYAVLVHTGFNCHAGHYFCYIKVSRAGFAVLIDSKVALALGGQGGALPVKIRRPIFLTFLFGWCSVFVRSYLIPPLLPFSCRRAMASGTK